MYSAATASMCLNACFCEWRAAPMLLFLLDRQVEVMAGTGILIAGHGAALVNSIFLPQVLLPRRLGIDGLCVTTLSVLHPCICSML